MSSLAIRSCLFAIAMFCSIGVTTAQPASPFNDSAFVGRDSADNVTALFAELIEDDQAPVQIDLMIFYSAAGRVLTTLANVPLWRLPLSRWMFAAIPEQLPPVQQDSIRQATKVTFVAMDALAPASFVTMPGWWRLLPARFGTTGSCPNCTLAYMCCLAERSHIDDPAIRSLCANVAREQCDPPSALGENSGEPTSR